MTACVNKNHGRRVAGVVTASLVGALTLGGVSLAAVPTVALAEQGSLQASAQWNTSAKVTKATNGRGTSVSNPGKATFVGGRGYLVPTQVTNSNGDVTDVRDFTLSYEAPDGTSINDPRAYFLDSKKAPAAGLYKVTVTASGSSATGSATFTFKLVDAEAAKPYAYEVNSFDTTDDTSFVYNGKDFLTSNNGNSSIGFAIEGTKLDVVRGTTNAGEYDVKYQKVSGGVATDLAAGDSIKDAGSYRAVLTEGDGSSEYTVDFTVAQLDLSAGAYYEDVTKGSSFDLTKVEVGGQTVANGVLAVDDSTEVGQLDLTKTGKHTVVVKAKNADDKNVKDADKATASFDFYVVDTLVNNAFYGRSYANDSRHPVELYLEDGDSFDAGKVTLKDDDNSADATVTIPNDKLTVTVVDSKGNKVDKVTEAGTYKVTVRATAEEGDDWKWTGGSATFTLNVYAPQQKSEETLSIYDADGNLVKDGGTVDALYNGSDHKSDVTFKVAGRTEGTDYQVVLKDKDGKEAKEAVDAGQYTLEVKPLTFQFSDSSANPTVTLSVNPVTVADKAGVTVWTNSKTGEVSYLDHTGDSDWRDSKVTVPALKTQEVIWTGSDVEVPQAQYLLYKKDGSTLDTTAKDAPQYAKLDSSLYTVAKIKQLTDEAGKTVNKTVDALNGVGTYEVTIGLTDAAKDNYDLQDDTFTVTVRKAKSFTDVAADKWYAKPVEDAFQQFYVNGTSGTVLFTPEAEITRADAVGILYNMAGGPKVTDDLVTEDQGYATGFSDVDSHVYYAKALAWAHKVGVANGYADGTFAPNARITRQEFAALLMNYAKATGKYSAATEDKLSGLSDASGVDAWAREAVNWAVSNKVMGNGGYVAATSNISRAEVAAMAVNYQPKALVSDVNGVKPGERVH